MLAHFFHMVALDYPQAGRGGVEIAHRRHINLPCAVVINLLQINLNHDVLDHLESAQVDDAHLVVVGVIRRQLAGQTAGIRHIQLAVIACQALRLIANFHGFAGQFVGGQVDAVDMPLGVAGANNLPVGAVSDICSGIRAHIGIFVVECDASRRRNRDCGDMGFILGRYHLDIPGIVYGNPNLIADDDDVVGHIAKAGGLARVHLLPHAGDVLAVAHAKNVQRGVVGAHLAFVQHEHFLCVEAFRNVHLGAGEGFVFVIVEIFFGVAGPEAHCGRHQKQECFFHRYKCLRFSLDLSPSPDAQLDYGRYSDSPRPEGYSCGHSPGFAPGFPHRHKCAIIRCKVKKILINL